MIEILIIIAIITAFLFLFRFSLYAMEKAWNYDSTFVFAMILGPILAITFCMIVLSAWILTTFFNL